MPSPYPEIQVPNPWKEHKCSNLLGHKWKDGVPEELMELAGAPLFFSKEVADLFECIHCGVFKIVPKDA